MKGFHPAFIITFLILSSKTLFASDLGDTFRLHGFLSQGYLHSNGNNFLADSTSGTFHFNEIGLNANILWTDRFRFGAQILSRDLGDYGDNDIRLDWALADFHFHDVFGLRTGKIKIPMGFYNTERDSDFLRPMIFLPQSIYDETRRDIWLAHLGVEFYGNLLAEDRGDLDYQLFAGRIIYDSDSVFLDAIEKNITERLNGNRPRPLPGRIPALPAGLSDFDRENKYIYGLGLVYTPPVNNLRVGFTIASQKDDTLANGRVIGDYDIKSKFVFSLEYSWKVFTAACEYSENNRTQTLFGEKTVDGPSQSWYAMITYSPLERLTFSLLYDEYYRLKHDKHGESDTRRNLDALPWRKDWAAGIRYDHDHNWTVKGEWHIIEGGAFLIDFFNPQGTERYWQYGALKVSYNF